MHYYKTFKSYSIAIWKQDQTLASDPNKYVRDKKWSQGKVRNHCGMKIQNPRFCYLSSMYMDIKCFVFRWILKRYSHLLLLPQLPWYNIFLFVFFCLILYTCKENFVLRVYWGYCSSTLPPTPFPLCKITLSTYKRIKKQCKHFLFT